LLRAADERKIIVNTFIRLKQGSRAVAGILRDAAVKFDRYGVCRQLFVSNFYGVAVDMTALTYYKV